MWKLYRSVALAGVSAAFAVRAASPAAPAQARPQPLLSGLPAPSLSGPCFESGKGYLRARIRGSIRLDVDLHGPKLACEGGPRSNGSGIRMAFEGPVRPDGRRVRMVFGIGGAKEGRPGRELPTNLTVIFEGEKLLFATQGEGNCTVDRLTQEPIAANGAVAQARAAARSGAGSAVAKGGSHATAPRSRSYRVTAHGFCIAPANDIRGQRRILVTTFDFAGRADFDTP